MCEFIKPKKLTFGHKISPSAKPQIKPLLSRKVEKPMNLHIDIMKYEFSKLFVRLVQHIKTKYQNMGQVITDFVNDEEVAVELYSDSDSPCFQLTYKADILNAKNRILERCKKVSIEGMLRIFC